MLITPYIFFAARREKEREKALKSETQKLQEILEAGESEAAINAALNIIKNRRPELLNPDADMTDKTAE